MNAGNSDFFKQLGRQIAAAHEEAANAETTMPMMDLPGGIKAGIAQVVECKFDQYKEGDNKGKWYFYAAAVVVEPKVHEGRKVAGLRTSIMEPMCDTPTRKRATVEAHLHYVYNEFRKLGVDTRQIQPDQLEAVAEQIKAARPMIVFSTRLGKPNPPTYPDPKVFEEWGGLAEYTVSEDGDDGMHDDTEAHVPAPTPVPAPAPKPAPKPKAAQAPKPAPAPVVEAPAALEPTLDDLVMTASGPQGDEATEAQAALTAKAKALGVPEADIQGADDWQAVADLIVTAEANKDMLVWQEGDTCKHAPLIDKKTKKRGPEALFAVTAVDAKAKTANLKGIDDAKVSYAKVPWSELSEA